MCQVLEIFDEMLERKNVNLHERLDGNELIDTAIRSLYEKGDHESFVDVITSLCFRMKKEGCGLVPFVTSEGAMFSELDISELKEGDTLTIDHEVRMRMDTVAAGDEVEWLYIFTNEEELHRNRTPDVIVEVPFEDIFQIAARNEKVAGVVINPFGKYFKVDKKVIDCIFEVYGQMEEA